MFSHSKLKSNSKVHNFKCRFLRFILLGACTCLSSSCLVVAILMSTTACYHCTLSAGGIIGHFMPRIIHWCQLIVRPISISRAAAAAAAAAEATGRCIRPGVLCWLTEAGDGRVGEHQVRVRCHHTQIQIRCDVDGMTCSKLIAIVRTSRSEERATLRIGFRMWADYPTIQSYRAWLECV
jgi:hypothetical protein